MRIFNLNYEQKIKIAGWLRRKRALLALVSVFGMIFLVHDVTYAWYYNEQNKTNYINADHPEAYIAETFEPPEHWQPGQTVTKSVKFVNSGDTDLILRVSLDEFALLYEVDITTGNLYKTYTPDRTVMSGDPYTWTAGAYMPAAPDSPLYKRSAQLLRSAGFGPADDMRDYGISRYIHVNFNATLASGTSWVYDNGYYYYTKPFTPGATDYPLIDSVTLDRAMPNTYKGLDYRLNVYMEALPANSASLDSGYWALSSGIETMLRSFCGE